MPRITECHPLLSEIPGTKREVVFHRYGANSNGEKIYIQAALHADETPAMAVAHHLLQMLEQADKENRIKGEIVVAPCANPIGLSQFENDYLQGRSHRGGEGNFNRGWFYLTDMVKERIKGKLGDNAEQNVSTIREAMQSALSEVTPKSEFDSLRLLLAREAADADYVFDLHCDDDSLEYLYISDHNWPDCQDFAADFGARAVLMAENSGGHSFDEVFTRPWAELARLYPDHPIPQAAISMTVELRGQPDVSDELGAKDALALYRFMIRRGLVEGETSPLPELRCEATRTDACEIIAAPGAGFVTFAVNIGDQVKKGDLVATLIDPAAQEPAMARTPILAGTDGLVLSLRTHKAVKPGLTVAKIVGKEPLAAFSHGFLLED